MRVEMITVVSQIVCEVVVRCALALAVIVDNQVTREPHQPVLQITLLGVVLIQRTVNSNKNFLSQIFCGICARREAISEIVDAAGITLDNLFPRRAIARPTPANQLGSFAHCQSLNSSHHISPGTCRSENSRAAKPLSERFTTGTKVKFSITLIQS